MFEIEKVPEIVKQRNITTEAIKNNIKDGVLVLPEFVSVFSKTINQLLQDNNVDFIVYPSIRGGCNMQQVPKNPPETEGRVPFPKEWLGQPKEKLPEHVTFCHNSNWLLAIDNDNIEIAGEIARRLADISRDIERNERFEKINSDLDL